MAKLLRCVECNGQVSESVYTCPHCRTLFFKGARCLICDRPGKVSDMREVFHIHSSPKPDQHTYGHVQCIDEVHSEFNSVEHKFKCPTCKTINSSDTKVTMRGKITVPCSNCGEYLKVYSECPVCKLLVVIKHGIKIYTYGNPWYSHNICYRYKPVKIRKLWGLW